MEKESNRVAAVKRLASFNSSSRRNKLETVYMLLPFLLIHLIIYSTKHYHPWWLYVLFLVLAYLNVVLAASKEIHFFDSKEMLISRKFLREKRYAFDKIYFHKSVGGARSTFYKLLIIRSKESDRLIFRIPVDSDEEEEKVLDFLKEICGLQQRKWLD